MISSHHILHEKTAWASRTDSRRLRGIHSLIPRIDREVHNELHNECPHVPLLGSYALRTISGLFVPIGDTMRDMDRLLSAIDKGTKHSRTHPIERELAGLAMEAIELQRPYIQDGLTR